VVAEPEGSTAQIPTPPVVHDPEPVPFISDPPTFYPMSTGGSFPGGKGAGSWSWSLTSSRGSSKEDSSRGSSKGDFREGQVKKTPEGVEQRRQTRPPVREDAP